MAATRQIADMTERNRDLRWVTERQVRRMRDDTRAARRLAFYEYTRLDEIMRVGLVDGGGNIDVERYRAAYETEHADERDPEAPDDEPAARNNPSRGRPIIMCVASVTLAVIAVKILS